MTKTILITGATGAVSTALLASLKGSKNKIRALVRNETKAAALKAQGIDVFTGDLEHPATLTKAFDGVDAAWILSPPGPRAPEQSSNAVWACRQAGVSHIVRMSALGAAHNAPTINSRLHALSDREVAHSGIPYTIVKPHFFMQNLMMSAQSVAKEGVMPFAMGEGKVGMVDVRDVGEFAARVLTTGNHYGKTYDVTGPVSLSLAQVAEQLGTALKKTVKYVPVTVEQAIQAMQAMGLDAFGLNMMTDYFNAYSNNWGDFTTNDYQNVTGKAPRAFADFAHDFATAFGGK